MGREEASATPMYVDNSGAVDRRDLKVREYVAHGSIEVRKIETDDNVADVFTKSLSANAHHKHVKTARGI
eukprot:1012339-Pleurochrysis_carterae.AAC.1